MQTTRLKRIALPKFVAGWMVFFAVAGEPVQAQFVNPVPPPPPPVFNPSRPNTVPQSPEIPISPRTPSTLPGSDVLSPGTPSALPEPDVLSPSGKSPADTNTHSDRQAVTPTTVTPDAGKAHQGRQATRHHRRSLSRGTDVAVGTVSAPVPSYRPPLGSDAPYCVWRPEWDGYWAPACSWR